MRKVIHIYLRCVFVNEETDIQGDFYKISMAYLSFYFFTLNKYKYLKIYKEIYVYLGILLALD